jgi:pyridoxamine 5'-phosphate oxidase
MTLADLRLDYTRGGLHESDAGDDPIAFFQSWFEQVQQSEVVEPNAMTLCTATPEGKPSARIVLLKGFDARGFTFFTNYESHKATELEANPFAALLFLWKELERQVRIEGVVSKTSESESDAYFTSRPRGSQLGAWASEQSTVISGREVLEARLKELQLQYGDGPIPRPPHWGGYRLAPTLIEFWQGRPSRLHDRIRFRKVESAWVRERLSP